jgi:hypothetical protein
MKRLVDFLLLLVLFLSVGYIVAVKKDPAPIVTTRPTQAPLVGRATETLAPSAAGFIPAILPTSTLMPASVTIPTKTPTRTPSPSPMPTRTIPASATPVPSATPSVSPQDPEIQAGLEVGNEIIVAIEAYRADQGHYPGALSDLVPDYFIAIPETKTAQPYLYRFFDSSDPMAAEVYWLSFKVLRRAHTSCTYYRRIDYWDCNFLSP